MLDVGEPPAADWAALWGRGTEALRMAVLSMAAHRLRTFLTMLGIIIGIAAVVSVVALGEGSRQRILKDISSIGTNTIDIMPGRDFGDERSGRIRTLTPRDAVITSYSIHYTKLYEEPVLFPTFEWFPRPPHLPVRFQSGR